MIIFASILISTILGISDTEKPRTTIVWHWEDEYRPLEKDMIESWLNQVTMATEETLGNYPFDLHLFIHRRDGSSEPVPWASTRRHEVQGVDFYIDPSYSLKAFLDDWTAPHEISHLSIPFLGSEEAWFAEGYASFMQYQIMLEMGIYSHEEIQAIYAGKIENCIPAYNREEDFVTVARELRDRNRYPDMYWGGASYFMQLEQQLRENHGRSVSGIIQEYLLCCRLEDQDMDELIKTWDRLLGDVRFSQMLKRYRTVPANEILGD